MDLLRSTKHQFLILLTFGLVVFFAQTVSLKHDVEHQFHETQLSCAAFLAFHSHADFNVFTLESIDSVKDLMVSSYYLSAIYLVKPSSFAIRAPPQYLQS